MSSHQDLPLGVGGAHAVASRLAAWLFNGVAVLSAVLTALPLVLCVATPPFAGRWIGVGLFLAAVLERVWAMYLRPGVRHVGAAAARDWTALAVGYAYALTIGAAGVEFVVRRHGLPGRWPLVGGAAFYLAAVGLRYWAFAVLRSQWHVDVTDVGGQRHLVCDGPYRFVRHPLYLGALLEAVALPVMLGAVVAAGFGLLVFAPLEVARARYEEHFLRTLFGPAYARYAAEVPGLLPRPWRWGRRRPSGPAT